MGQQLLEPPDVNGWELGAGWFSSGRHARAHELRARSSRRTRSSTCGTRSRGHVNSPEALVVHALDRLTPPEYSSGRARRARRLRERRSHWTGSDAQLATKASGVVHLIVGSGDYQLV